MLGYDVFIITVYVNIWSFKLGLPTSWLEKKEGVRVFILKLLYWPLLFRIKKG